MASTIGIAGRAVQPDEAVLKGMKRSRFSLHFITRRVRYWILVQMVSVPMQTGDETPAEPVQFGGSRTTIVRLLDDYMVIRSARRWA